jgi:sulfite oxidase
MTLYGKRADMLVHEAEPYNAEPTAAALAEAFVTPVDTFYSRNHGPVPDGNVQTWRLTVTGMVARELELSIEDLQTRFQTCTVTATLQCAGNRRAGLIAVRDIPNEHPWGQTATSTAEWTGVRLADVLAEAGPEEGAQHVSFDAPDVSTDAKPAQAYGSSIPLAKAGAPEVLLAWQMNGQPLAPVHGAPLRVVVPGYIGARSVKWVQRITVGAAPSDNYFQATAYRLLPPEADADTAGPNDGISLGPVALNSVILSPADGATVGAGPLQISGYAYAGGERAVARVDISVDDGRSWTQADLGEDRGDWAWRMWRGQVDLSPGQVEIVARAWDTSAASQPESPGPLWNPKGYVNNSWPRIVVNVGPASS